MTHVWLFTPIAHVLEIASPREIDVRRLSDEHVVRGDDVDDGRLFGVVESEPYRHWDIVGHTTVGDGDCAMDAKEELSAPVVVRVDLRLRSEGRETIEDGEDVWLYAVR